MHEELALYIGGEWRPGTTGRTQPVIDPADESAIAALPLADAEDLDAALAAADASFREWRARTVFEREAVLRRTARLLDDRTEAITRVMTREQGKPLAEARGEIGRRCVSWYTES